MEEELRLETRQWKGQTRYICPEPDCDFDGYSVLSVVKHHKEVHQEPEELAGPVLFDADDKPITRTTAGASGLSTVDPGRTRG